MPTSLREQVLGTFLARLRTIPDVPTVVRSISWAVDRAQMPAIVQVDGGDDVREVAATRLYVETSVTVALAVDAASDDAIGPDLNALAASVRAAIGDDWTLGGLANVTRYAGSTEPMTLAEEGAPRVGIMTLNFVIERYEHPLDPYAS